MEWTLESSDSNSGEVHVEVAAPAAPAPAWPERSRVKSKTSRARCGLRASGRKQLEDQIYEMQVRICKAFASASRLRILDLLAKRECTVSDLQRKLGITTANVSQHLAILKSAGVVATRRDGKQIYCSLAIPEVKQACHLIRNVLRAQIRNGRRLLI